ncbi:MAG: 6-phosphogluconolactonase [Deltaproteobacteria bacterium]|nr:6-phosphogluconolactonase [Deltaproteobacteria bacterium]
MPRVLVAPDVAALHALAADTIAATLGMDHHDPGTRRLALAGGSTPRGVHAALLALAGGPRAIDWSRVEIVFGDERMVTPDDPASNYRMAKDTLLDALAPPPRGVLRIPGELPPAAAADAYEAMLGARPIDVLLLGMGDDGHVASLFPDTPEPDPARRVVATTSPIAPHARVTVTYRTIHEARAVVLVAAGAAKADRLAEVWRELTSGAAGTARLPAARVAAREVADVAARPVTWIVDAAAAARLPEEATHGQG